MRSCDRCCKGGSEHSRPPQERVLSRICPCGAIADKSMSRRLHYFEANSMYASAF